MTDPLFPPTADTAGARSAPPTGGGGPRKEPEELHPALESFLRIWNEYRTPLVGGVLALLAILLVATQVSQSRATKQHDATTRLVTAAQRYMTVVLTPEVTAEQAESVLSDAIAICDQLRVDYPGIPQSHRAAYIAGNCFYERALHSLGPEGTPRAVELVDQAFNRYNAYLDEATVDVDRAEALIAIASCLENRSFFTGDVEAMKSAVNQLREAARLGKGTYLEAQALIGVGRCQESLGLTDEARQTYREVLALRSDLPTSAGQGVLSLTTRTAGYHELATERLERVETGVAPADANS
jgi:tetratricopeptide (TPR) repeat protein